MKKYKKEKPLMFSITKYYITLILIMGSIFTISYLFSGYILTKNIKENKVPIYNIINNINDDITKANFDMIKNIGGYVQILDEDRNVIKTIGEKDIFIKKYSEEELIELIAINKKDREYNVVVNKFVDKKLGNITVLIMLPNEKISYEANLIHMPYSVNKYFIKLYLKVIGCTTFIGIVCIIIYSLYTTKKINRPLREMGDVLQKIINGNYDVKVDIHGENEFIVVGEIINVLTDRLSISEEKNKRLIKSKNRLILDLSHDIKIPITTIKGFSMALYQDLIKEENKQRYYKTICNKSERVEELVDDLFNYVKLDNADIEYVKEKVDLCEYLRQVVLKYIDEFEERGFEVEINIPEEEIFFEIEVNLFKRAIINIIENALKYNDDKTKMRIEIRDIGKYIIIEIADDGVGIKDEIKESVFDEFVRGDESRKSDGGTGLGLSIADKVIKKHNGTIELKSNINEKTVFYIKLNTR